jgi:hypothetical protein
MDKNSGKTKSNRKKNKNKKKRKPLKSVSSRYSNFVEEAGPGCYIARRNSGGSKTESPDWMIGWEDVDPEDFDFDESNDDTECEVPDIAIDPEECTLSICNIHSYAKVAYVTVFDTRVVGANGNELKQGSTTDNDGKTVPCVTFIVLCPPYVFVHLCYLNVSSEEELSGLRIESDVSRWNQHPNPSDEHPYRIGFPLNCNGPNTGETCASFLCTQGEEGELTHFFSGNLHAIDFRCPIGTELLAVADGIIVEAKDENTLTGISVTNLFQWNSILLQVQNFDADLESDRNNAGGDGLLFVEYVHIAKSAVQAGDRVKRGQVIGYSGSVGFSPEPHLHFSAFRSSDADAPTVRVLFENRDNDNEPLPFLPRSGKWYDANGIVKDATRPSTL